MVLHEGEYDALKVKKVIKLINLETIAWNLTVHLLLNSFLNVYRMISQIVSTNSQLW